MRFFIIAAAELLLLVAEPTVNPLINFDRPVWYGYAVEGTYRDADDE